MTLIRHIFNKLPIRLRCLIQSVGFGGVLNIGATSHIHKSVHILGKTNIRLGKNSCVSEGSWLNVNHRKEAKIAIDIGSNCFIGKSNFFSSGDVIFIGDFTLTAVGCKFIGSTHIFDDPKIPYITTGTTCYDRIEVGVNCFFGAGATVLGDVKIGHGSIIGANALVMKDIPPFSMVIGNPAKIVKRYCFEEKTWLPISLIGSSIELSMPNEQEYLEYLNLNYSDINMPWIASGRSMGNL